MHMWAGVHHNAEKFKPNCALVIASFLMRRAYITPDNCGDYEYIVNALHRDNADFRLR